MPKHFAILATTSAIGLLASSPAMAQVDDRYAGVPPVAGVDTVYKPGWEAEAAAGAAYSTAESSVVQEYYAEPVIADIGTYHADYSNESEYADHEPRRRIYRTIARRDDGSHLAYSAAQRAEWLSQCRSLHTDDTRLAYYEGEGGDNGGLVGGLLGAVAGGVIGNRVADGDRLGGTLIGAGLGGLAGAVIGSAIGSNDDDDREYPAGEEYGFDYCEAYLLNYERGYGVPGQVTYAPVAMVPVAQQAMQHEPHRHMITHVIPEDVEVERPAPPAPRRHIHSAAPAPQGKLRPIK